MNYLKITTITLSLFLLTFIYSMNSFAGSNTVDSIETDKPSNVLVYFFDLRERESFIQVTNTDSDGHLIHIQIYDVANLCNENDFFDNYTGNDNMFII